MPIDIHGKTVHIERNSPSADHAAKYLAGLEPSEAHTFFEAAKLHHSSHFEAPEHYEDRRLEHDMTLEHQSDGSYLLRKRS